MPRRIILILIILLFGCLTKATAQTIVISESNKDVLILATLIRDHLKRTNAQTLNLNELVQSDTLQRITNNFEKLELKPRGGYISVYYKFTKTRDNQNIQLADREKKLWVKWAADNLDGQYSGEIRLAYGERFYHLKKIIIQKDKGTAANSK